MNEILTPRLLLRPFSVADVEATMQGDDVLAAHLGVPVAAGWLEFPEALPFFLGWIQAHPDKAQWMMYGYYGRNGEGLVGGGGFKGPPSAEGVCEIGYGLAPGFRGRGFATEAAEGLAACAFAQPGVTAVIAHTLPEANPSTRVLERAGFACDGAVMDPADGEVWRWRRTRGAGKAPALDLPEPSSPPRL